MVFQGLGSDLFVVSGGNVGQEKVLVNVVEPTLENLEDEIGLTVAEAISIEPPSPLYVLVDTQIQYTLKTLRYKHPAGASFFCGWKIFDLIREGILMTVALVSYTIFKQLGFFTVLT